PSKVESHSLRTDARCVPRDAEHGGRDAHPTRGHSRAQRASRMTPSRTINLLRGLFVVFACFVGDTIGAAVFDSHWIGIAAGLAFGLVIVLIDRLLKGFTLRTFSSATFGLLLGLIFSRLLLASDVLRPASG